MLVLAVVLHKGKPVVDGLLSVVKKVQLLCFRRTEFKEHN